MGVLADTIHNFIPSGIVLMLWIVQEWYVWGFNALSNIYFILGLTEVAVAVISLQKRKK